MKLIGITLRTDNLKERQEVRDCIDQSLVKWVFQHNLIPILIPNNALLFKATAKQIKFDGFILSGGNDSKAREELENAVLQYSLSNNLPVLGICHGFQAINLFFEGSHFASDSHVNIKHDIKIDPGVLGVWEASVNSYHSNIITADLLSKNMDIIARCSLDGSVEAALHSNGKILGIMWHPERQGSCAELDTKILEYLFR